MDRVCAACGEADVVEISTFGDISRRFMCAHCGSELTASRKAPPVSGYRPPSVGLLTQRMRATEQSLPPTAMERVISNNRWEEDVESIRDDLLDLLNELEAE